MMNYHGWTIEHLAQDLKIPVRTAIRIVGGAGKVSAEERSALLKRFPAVSWEGMSGENDAKNRDKNWREAFWSKEDGRVIEETRALMQRMKEKTLWGRIKKWLRL
jgi:hypothetical protein